MTFVYSLCFVGVLDFFSCQSRKQDIHTRPILHLGFGELWSHKFSVSSWDQVIHGERCQGVRLDLSNDWSLNCTNAQQQPEAKIEFNWGSIVPQEGGNISTCVPPRYVCKDHCYSLTEIWWCPMGDLQRTWSSTHSDRFKSWVIQFKWGSMRIANISAVASPSSSGKVGVECTTSHKCEVHGVRTKAN